MHTSFNYGVLFSLLFVIHCNQCDKQSTCLESAVALIDLLVYRDLPVYIDLVVSIPDKSTSSVITDLIFRKITRISSKINVLSTLWNLEMWESNDGILMILFPCLNETEFLQELSTIASFLQTSQTNKYGRLWTPFLVFTHPKIFPHANMTEQDPLIQQFIPNFLIDTRIFILYTILTENSQSILAREIYSIRGTIINRPIKPISILEETYMNQLIFRTRQRSNFQKAPVIAIGIDDPDYPLATAFKPNTTELIGGFEVEVYQYFRDALNFTEVAIRSTGYIREGPNHTLTGSAVLLNNESGDIAIGAGEFLEVRVKSKGGLTYIHAMFHAKVEAYFKQPPASSIRNIFTQTFTTNLWNCSLIIWIVIVLILRAFVKLVRRNDGMNNPKDIVIAEESFLWAAAAMCQQGWHISPHSTPVKVVFFCGIFVGLISYIAYSAALVSILAVEVVPIKEFKDLITEKFFITSDGHIPTAKEVVKGLEESGRIPKLGEKIRNVEIPENLERLITKRFALITIPDSFYPVIQQNYTNGFICDTVAAKVVSKLKSSCLVRRGAPIREYLNYKLLVMQERGVKFRMINEYNYGTSVQCLQSSGSVQLTLGLRDLFTAFAILASGFGISVSSAIAEKLYNIRLVHQKLNP